MSENTEAQPAEKAAKGGCCGVSSCCTDTEQSLDPAVTVIEAKANAGCGCVSDQDGATDLPVVVIGAGPVGLAAAAHLAERGLDFVVLEVGDKVGAAISEWGHVRLFSPWRYEPTPPPATCWSRPGGNCPTRGPADRRRTGPRLPRPARRGARVGRADPHRHPWSPSPARASTSPAPSAATSARCWSERSARTAP